MRTKYILPALMALTLLGAGCLGESQKAQETANTATQTGQADNTNTPSQTATVVTPESPTSGNAVTETPSTPTTTPTQSASSTSTFTVDDTWQTYSNKALSFEFRWPTKGRYAPEWSVEFRKSDDPTIKDGCVTDSKTLNSETKFQDFCHTTSVIETDAVERTDYFATKKGNQYIVVSFFKKLYPGEKYKANSAADYEAMLQTIMSTFKYTE